jgi:glycosyltransferase involved in cell wall biosynthesis
MIKVHLDDIIYALQPEGGISCFWKEITSRIEKNICINISRSNGSKKSRFLPVHTNSDIFHSSYFRNPIGFQKHTKTVVTVHDLIYEEWLEDNRNFNIIINCWQRKRAIEKANAIVCISNTTKEALLNFYPDLQYRLSDISVIYHGISFSQEQIQKISNQTNRLKYLLGEINSRYVLFVGGRVSYKNFDLALEGFARSNLYKEKDYYFICTGKPFKAEEKDLIDRLNLTNKVKIVSHATEEELILLYKNAYVLLYLSSKEGFGLPPLEAMSCKCPVITSNCNAVSEIVGEASIVINTNDLASIANGIDLFLEKSIRNKYILLGESRVLNFDWDIAANKYLAIYNDLATAQIISNTK